jgi:ATP-dependent DNA helicase RecG
MAQAESLLSRIEQANRLDGPVSLLRSTGAKRLRGLDKLGISTIRDMLRHYPFRYNDFSQIVPIASSPLGEILSVHGTIDSVTVKRPRPRLFIIEVALVDETGVLIATWFNQPWLQKELVKGARLILRGKVEHSFGFRRMNSPLYTILADEDETGGIMPVYRANADIPTGWVARVVDEALTSLPALIDPLPAALRIEHGLMSRHVAFREIHHPQSAQDYREARRRLAFEEILYLQLHLLMKKNRLQAENTPHSHTVDGAALQRLKAQLPFELTADQSRATQEILADLASPLIMNRLLLGDVGSGKTIVAAFALACAADSDSQAAMMAPTEVLAVQYAQKLGPLFDAAGITWGLLTSSTKEGERNKLLDALAAGSINVLFGTHALIEPDVRLSQLSLVIIDEQHRFGVEQREALRLKGEGCDLLTMTATPIPRSLALTIYGDMDSSYILSKPRASVQTSTQVIDKHDIRIAYESIRAALERGEQAYIVCPLISTPNDNTGGQEGQTPSSPGGTQDDAAEEDEPLELLTEFSEEQDGDHIQAAEDEVRFLKGKVFPDKNIALMTSKLKGSVKQKVMDDFRAGLIDILVSTTVIEVGVDVPNATIMVIQDADRFGLSQLHQLRGRVGRGERNGEVYLVSGTRNPDARQRLAIMENCSDGFELAEEDLKLRREGDVLGSRQHGAAALKLVNVIRDAPLIQRARENAQKILALDPLLEQPLHAHLSAELKILFEQEGLG